MEIAATESLTEKQQRNMSQIKDEEKKSRTTKWVAIGNLFAKDCRVMIENNIQDLMKRMETQIKKIKEMLKQQQQQQHTTRRTEENTEMNSANIEMKNILEGINRRITEVEGRRSEVEDKMLAITLGEQVKEKQNAKESGQSKRHWGQH